MKVIAIVSAVSATMFLSACGTITQSAQNLHDQCSNNLSQASAYDTSERMKLVRERYGKSAGLLSVDEASARGGKLNLLSKNDYLSLVEREAKRFGASPVYKTGQFDAYSTTTAILANVTKEGPSESAVYVRVGNTIYITQIYIDGKPCGIWNTTPKKS